MAKVIRGKKWNKYGTAEVVRGKNRTSNVFRD